MATECPCGMEAQGASWPWPRVRARSLSQNPVLGHRQVLVRTSDLVSHNHAHDRARPPPQEQPTRVRGLPYDLLPARPERTPAGLFRVLVGKAPLAPKRKR